MIWMAPPARAAAAARAIVGVEPTQSSTSVAPRPAVSSRTSVAAVSPARTGRAIHAKQSRRGSVRPSLGVVMCRPLLVHSRPGGTVVDDEGAEGTSAPTHPRGRRRAWASRWSPYVPDEWLLRGRRAARTHLEQRRSREDAGPRSRRAGARLGPARAGRRR